MSDLVQVTEDSGIQLDLRYATSDNNWSAPLYSQARAYVHTRAFQDLLSAHEYLKAKGYGLKLFDAYRPLYVSKAIYMKTPEQYRGIYVANPNSGSNHNRGLAVDVGLVYPREADGQGADVEQPSKFDCFSSRAHTTNARHSDKARRYISVLTEAMQLHSFQSYSMEWWHFTHKGPSSSPSSCPILNIPVEDVADLAPGSKCTLTKREESKLIERLLQGMSFRETQDQENQAE